MRPQQIEKIREINGNNGYGDKAREVIENLLSHIECERNLNYYIVLVNGRPYMDLKYNAIRTYKTRKNAYKAAKLLKDGSNTVEIAHAFGKSYGEIQYLNEDMWSSGMLVNQ